jgi:excisionase family DNA binding protein
MSASREAFKYGVEPAEKCLSVKETAKRLGVCAHTVYTLVREGELPAFRVRNQWRINESTLSVYMQAQNLPPSAP